MVTVYLHPAETFHVKPSGWQAIDAGVLNRAGVSRLNVQECRDPAG
jgi:hypothetical protein